MPPETVTNERDRAVARLAQLSLEQRAAVEAGDVERMILLADLIGPAVEKVQRTVCTPDAKSAMVIREAQEACGATSAYLRSGLFRVTQRLRELHRAKVTMRGYRPAVPRASALDARR